jgi:hypothetical protein
MVEKCYKLHRFPLGFKFTRNKSASTSFANQVQAIDPPSFPFTQAQCQQLMAFMQNNYAFTTSLLALQPSSISNTTTNCLIPSTEGNSIALIHSESVFLHPKYSFFFPLVKLPFHVNIIHGLLILEPLII